MFVVVVSNQSMGHIVSTSRRTWFPPNSLIGH